MAPLKSLSLLAATAFLLAGCIIQSNPPPRPIPMPVAVKQGPQSVNKTIAAGTTQTIAHSVYVNPDCTTRGVNEMRVIQPPAHGTLQVVHRSDYPLFAGPYSVCNKTKVPGVFADYTPAQGYTGPDYVGVEVLTLYGADIEHRITITVK